VVDPDINKRVGRINPETIHGEPRSLLFLQTEPAPPPNSGMAGTLKGSYGGIQAALCRGEAQDVFGPSTRRMNLSPPPRPHPHEHHNSLSRRALCGHGARRVRRPVLVPALPRIQRAWLGRNRPSQGRLLPRRAGLLLSRMTRPRRVGMGSGGSLIGIGASIEHHPGLCRVEVSFCGVKDVPAYATAYTLRAIERY
jgi:hypothetical protein